VCFPNVCFCSNVLLLTLFFSLAIGVCNLSGGSTVLVVKNCSQEAPVTVAALGVPYHGQGRKLNTVVHVMMTTDTLFPMAKAMMKHE